MAAGLHRCLSLLDITGEAISLLNIRQQNLTQYRDLSIWWLWWRPFLTLRYPAVIYATLTYGVTLGWLLLQSTANGVIVPDVYGFSSLAVGNISISVSHRPHLPDEFLIL